MTESESTSSVPAGMPPLPDELAGIVSESTVPVGDRQYRVLAIGDLVQYAARQPKGTEAPYWAIVWEASMALGGWLHERRKWIKGKRILELGSGLGLSGLAAADAGAQVVQTDKIPLALRMARENFLHNGLPAPHQFCVDWLEWSHDETYDIVLGSDLVYEPSVIPLLVPIFRANCRAGGRIVLSAPSHRQPALSLVDRLFDDGWDFITEVRTIQWQQRQTDVVLWLGRRR